MYADPVASATSFAVSSLRCARRSAFASAMAPAPWLEANFAFASFRRIDPGPCFQPRMPSTCCSAANDADARRLHLRRQSAAAARFDTPPQQDADYPRFGPTSRPRLSPCSLLPPRRPRPRRPTYVWTFCVSYGTTRVLDHVSLTVARGELVARSGSSGCGKTTLLRDRRVRAARPGRIVVDGRDGQAAARARGTAMMFQSYALWFTNVAANIGYGLRMRGAARRRSASASARCRSSCSSTATKRAIGAVGGQSSASRSVAAARGRSRVLLLDEPMSNRLSRPPRAPPRAPRALQRRVGITAIYVTHDRGNADARRPDRGDRRRPRRAVRHARRGVPPAVSPFVAGFMGADNAIDVVRSGDGWRGPGGGRDSARARALPCRRARLALPAPSAPATLAIDGEVTQRVYLGTQYRYRIRAGAEDFWVEGRGATRRRRAGPRSARPPEALLVFPAAA